MLVVDVWAGGAVPGLEGSSLGLSRVLGVTDREELTVWGAKDNGGCLTGGTFAIGMAVVIVVTDDSAADNEVVEGEGMVIPLLVFIGFVTRL